MVQEDTKKVLATRSPNPPFIAFQTQPILSKHWHLTTPVRKAVFEVPPKMVPNVNINEVSLLVEQNLHLIILLSFPVVCFILYTKASAMCCPVYSVLRSIDSCLQYYDFTTAFNLNSVGEKAD